MHRPIDAAQYDRLRELFLHVCELAPDERGERIAAECGDDLQLRAQIDHLLEMDADETDLFRGLSAAGRRSGGLIRRIAEQAGREPIPDEIGGYQIIRRIAQGGMGAVYEATQSSPRRVVAIKVLRAGLATENMLKRFEYEGEILGRLRHPGIAQIFEAGTAETAFGCHPYFVMEYIDGPDIVKYAAKHGLTINERLRLLAKLCDAVHHAHRNGVIHRDLKPANILVSEGPAEESAQPKILDFGVARTVGLDAQMTAAHTRDGQLIGTLQYMSPEQAAGDSGAIDTRADVYSLGVVAFEVLSGRRPYELDALALDDVVRTIRDEPAPRLGSMDSRLRGDIETIIATAMSKDRDRRYDSAAEMAADIRRLLKSLPISARRPTPGYHLRRFAARNRILVTTAACAVLLGTAGAVGTGIGFLRASQREAEAIAERLNAEVNIQFFESLFAEPTIDAMGQDASLAAFVREAMVHLETEWAGQPSAEARLRLTVGTALSALGDLENAETNLNLAVELAESSLGPEHRTTIAAHHEQAGLLSSQGHLDLAVEKMEAILEQREDLFGPSDPDTITSMIALAWELKVQDRFIEAESLLLLAQERIANGVDLDPKPRLRVMAALGSCLRARGRFAEAESILVQAHDEMRPLLGDRHLMTCNTANILGLLHTRAGNLEAAEKIFLRLLDTYRDTRGPDHTSTMVVTGNLGLVYSERRLFKEAEVYLRDCYETRLRTRGPEHHTTLIAQSNLANLLRDIGKLDEAEAYERAVLQAVERIHGRGHRHWIYVASGLSNTLIRQGELVEAEQLSSDAVRLARAKFPEGDNRTGEFLITYGRCLRKLERFDEAERTLTEAHQIQLDSVGPTHRQTLRAAEEVARLYEDWGRPEDAKHYRDQRAALENEDPATPESEE